MFLLVRRTRLVVTSVALMRMIRMRFRKSQCETLPVIPLLLSAHFVGLYAGIFGIDMCGCFNSHEEKSLVNVMKNLPFKITEPNGQ